MTRTTNGMNKGSINRPVHSPPERCIIRTSLRLNGVPSPPSRTKPGWATKHRWRRRYRRNPGRRGEPTQNFLTAIVTQNASESDKPGMAIVLSEQANMGLGRPRSCMSMARTCAGRLSTKLKKISVNCMARRQPHPIVARCSPWRPLI